MTWFVNNVVLIQLGTSTALVFFIRYQSLCSISPTHLLSTLQLRQFCFPFLILMDSLPINFQLYAGPFH